MAETTDLAKQEPQKNITVAVDDSSFSSYLDTAKFNQLWRVANVFAGSNLVPEHYQGKTNNCFLAIQMATRLEIEPMMFMQNSYIVHGRPGMEAKMVIALVNSRGPFTGPIQWRFEGQGKTLQCTAYATHKITKEVCEATVTWAMVEAEKWNVDKERKGGGIQKSKWNTMPDLMFQYRSAAFLAKLYCPEVIMGMPTAEELEDIESGDKYEPAPPKTGRIEERLRKTVENTAQTPEETAARLAEAEKVAEEKLGDTETPKSTPKPAPTDAEIQAELDAAALADAEIDEFARPVPPKAQNTKQAAPESTNAGPGDIPAENRYECTQCGMYFARPAGLNKNMCPKLHMGIIDRWAKQDKQ